MLVALLFIALFIICFYLFYNNLVLEEEIVTIRTKLIRRMEQNSDMCSTISVFRKRLDTIESKLERRNRRSTRK